jgi:hypothetical protein
LTQVPKFEPEAEIGQIRADFEKCRVAKVSINCQRHNVAKGSKKNMFAILRVDASSWKDVETQEYQAYSRFSQRSQMECISV